MENILLLDLTTANDLIPHKNSFVRNFPHVKIFYFSIPSSCTAEEKKHLIEFGNTFFLSQFPPSVENYLSIKNFSFLSDHIKTAHKISWEIFYKYNQWVKIRSNVFDGYLKTNVSGFTGRIINFFSSENQDVYQIALSGESLSKIKNAKLQSISKKYSPFYTYLEPEFLLPIYSQENKLTVSLIEILAGLIKSNNRIIPEDANLDEVSDFSDILFRWESYLNCFFKNNEIYIIRTKSNHIYNWRGIHSADESFGIWGEFENNDELFIYPLTDILEVFNDDELSDIFHNFLSIAKLILPN